MIDEKKRRLGPVIAEALDLVPFNGIIHDLKTGPLRYFEYKTAGCKEINHWTDIYYEGEGALVIADGVVTNLGSHLVITPASEDAFGSRPPEGVYNRKLMDSVKKVFDTIIEINEIDGMGFSAISAKYGKEIEKMNKLLCDGFKKQEISDTVNSFNESFSKEEIGDIVKMSMEQKKGKELCEQAGEFLDKTSFFPLSSRYFEERQKLEAIIEVCKEKEDFSYMARSFNQIMTEKEMLQVINQGEKLKNKLTSKGILKKEEKEELEDNRKYGDPPFILSDVR